MPMERRECASWPATLPIVADVRAQLCFAWNAGLMGVWCALQWRCRILFSYGCRGLCLRARQICVGMSCLSGGGCSQLSNLPSCHELYKYAKNCFFERTRYILDPG